MDFWEVKYSLIIQGFVLQKMWADVYDYSDGWVAERYFGCLLYFYCRTWIYVPLTTCIAGDDVDSKEDSEVCFIYIYE
jgi:hypothetical protein